MVLLCHAAIEIIRQHHARVLHLQMLALSLFHYTHTPVEVCRKAIAGVVGRGTGDISAGIECLMAHQHAVEEAVGSKLFGRRKATMAHEMLLVVDNIRIAIYHCGQLLTLAYRGRNILKCIV